MAAQIAALARSFVDQAAPTSDCAISQELMLWLLTQFASARSLLMVSAMTGRDGLQRQLEREPGGVLGDAPGEGDQLVGVDERERAPAKASMPPQPARNEGRLTVAMRSDCTGARRYRLPSVQCPEACPSNAVGPVVFTAAPSQNRCISESTSALAVAAPSRRACGRARLRPAPPASGHKGCARAERLLPRSKRPAVRSTTLRRTCSRASGWWRRPGPRPRCTIGLHRANGPHRAAHAHRGLPGARRGHVRRSPARPMAAAICSIRSS